MNRPLETTTALIAAHAHWLRMAMRQPLKVRSSPTAHPTGGYESPNGVDCALCDRFVDLAGDDDPPCTLDGEKCPVYEAVGEPECEAGPFGAAMDCITLMQVDSDHPNDDAMNMAKFLYLLIQGDKS